VKRIRLESPVKFERTVVTVGSFDGLHLGHRAVVDRVKEIAEVRSGTSIVVTFDPHPRRVIAPESAPKLLTTLDEKALPLERMGVGCLAVIPFTDHIRQLGPKAFVDRFLVEYLGAETIVLGYDHGFGKDRSGNLDTVRELAEERGFEVVSVPPTLLDGEPVSSTRVRNHVELGEMEEAAQLLGEAYPVAGEVESGDRRGKAIGFATANLVIEDDKLLPPNGVYAGWASQKGVQGKQQAVVNLGTRPTFEGKVQRFEAHLLDYDGDLYGKRLSISLVSRLRGERKFDGVDALTTQISEDIAEARRRLDGAGIPLDAHNRSTDGG
jgi:riboflavin kinase/FMN adenylyltransferase